MIYKTEFNPRDFKDYSQLIAHLQTDCIRKYGAGFVPLKFAMGQLSHNSELHWFEGYVDDADIRRGSSMETMKQHLDRQSNGAKIGQKATDICIDYATLLDAIRMDRMGLFSDSPKGEKAINIHIASLGTFNIDSRESSMQEVKEKVTKAILCAINDIKP